MAASSFENFLDRLPLAKKKKLEELVEMMDRSREQYKETVKEFYQKYPVFIEDRPDNQAEFKADLMHYDELVEHCLRAGDAEILYEFGIHTILNKEGIYRLARWQQLEQYVSIFEQLARNSEDDFERICWMTLYSKFRDFSQKNSSLGSSHRT